jgi:RNA polymerase sigma-70 factor (TIGR02943 family)
MMRQQAIRSSLTDTVMQNVETVRAQTYEPSANIDPDRWVDEHGDCLFRYALARVRDESLAEDLVQETLLSAIQSKTSYSGRSAEKTWLTSILKHKIIDHYRKNSRQVQITDEDLDMSGLNYLFERPDVWDGHWADGLRPVDPQQSPEYVLERSEFWAVMNRCMSAMPNRVAYVFSMREMDGLSSSEICEIMAISAHNFWVIMHRARMQLRRCIEIKWFRKAI